LTVIDYFSRQLVDLSSRNTGQTDKQTNIKLHCVPKK